MALEVVAQRDQFRNINEYIITKRDTRGSQQLLALFAYLCRDVYIYTHQTTTQICCTHILNTEVRR